MNGESKVMDNLSEQRNRVFAAYEQMGEKVDKSANMMGNVAANMAGAQIEQQNTPNQMNMSGQMMGNVAANMMIDKAEKPTERVGEEQELQPGFIGDRSDLSNVADANGNDIDLSTGGSTEGLPSSAKDGDRMDKAWEAKTEQIIAQHKHNPHELQSELHKAKVEYWRQVWGRVFGEGTK